jgi:methyl-accepting chemotaxis protein
MGFLTRLRLGARLGIAFGITGFLVCLIGIFGLTQMARVMTSSEDVATNWLPSVQILGDIRATLNSARRYSLRVALEADASGKKKQGDIMLDLTNTTLPKQLATYEKLISSDEERAIYKEIQAALATYKSDQEKALALSNEGEASYAQARDFVIGTAGKSFTDLMALVQKDVDLNAKGGADSWAEVQRVYGIAVKVLIGAVVLLLGVCAVLASVITRSITVPLSEAVRLTKAVAAGDLSQRPRSDAADEPGDLMRALGEMSHNLSSLIYNVRQGTDAIATASAEIAQGNADLSSRTEQQAASLQQTAASMHQMNDTVQSNSDNARQANQLVAQATMVAAQGGQDVSEVVATMSAIQESSRRISDIISVIDGIAFQTNILALNAAVEAARAGEQGRGFAVVASEVRSLAQRSANAAKEIKSLITDSVEKVDIGNTQAHNAGRTIEEVVMQVRKVNDLIAEITASSSEQSSGVSQINLAVNQLDQSTQQNAALVEQTSAAAESLRQQAGTLLQSVSVFKVSA